MFDWAKGPASGEPESVEILSWNELFYGLNRVVIGGVEIEAWQPALEFSTDFWNVLCRLLFAGKRQAVFSPLESGFELGLRVCGEARVVVSVSESPSVDLFSDKARTSEPVLMMELCQAWYAHHSNFVEKAIKLKPELMKESFFLESCPFVWGVAS